MAGSVRKRQKKLERTRKKRDALKKDARKREAQFQGRSLLSLAQAAPFGPAWISTILDHDAEDGHPGLVTVVVTRRVRGALLAHSALVDRTCLGVKNAMVLPLLTEVELRESLDRLFLDEYRECEPLEAQSVVFHALDYASSLGFGPHEDFERGLFEPRPEVLLDTPLAKPARPLYISGPNDDVPMILDWLEERVGAENFQFIAGNAFDLLGDDDEGEYDELDGEFAGGEEFETTGESVDS
jgi:hypothetical protein